MTIEVINQKNELAGSIDLPDQDHIDIIGINGRPVRVHQTPETGSYYIVIGDH